MTMTMTTDGDIWCRGDDGSGVGGCGGSDGGCGDGGSGEGGDSVDVGRGDNDGSGDSYGNGNSDSGNGDSGDKDSNSNSGGGDSNSGKKNNNQLKAAVKKAAMMVAAEAAVAAAMVLTLVATRVGGGYGDPPRNITKWSLGAGGAISLRFFCDKLTNLGWLTLSILKYLMKTKKFVRESAWKMRSHFFSFISEWTFLWEIRQLATAI
jgi:hypothetical protein